MASIIFAFAKWIVLGALIGVSLWAAVKAYAAWQAQRARRRAELAALRGRADWENRLALAGDPLGTYGEYTPATMPLADPPTQPLGTPREWYDYGGGLQQ
ncbi:hypothetical protein [Mycobacterium shimoidei]|nr:hypothetical protein [Mycobacterium shimoidei]